MELHKLRSKVDTKNRKKKKAIEFPTYPKDL